MSIDFPGKCCPKCGGTELRRSGTMAKCLNCGAFVYHTNLKDVKKPASPSGLPPLISDEKTQDVGTTGESLFDPSSKNSLASGSTSAPSSILVDKVDDDERALDFWREFKPKTDAYSEQEIADISIINRLLRSPDDGKPIRAAFLEAYKRLIPIYNRHNRDDLYLYWKINSVFSSVSLNGADSMKAMVGHYYNLRQDLRPDPVLVVKASMRMICVPYLRCIPVYLHTCGAEIPASIIAFPLSLAAGASDCAIKMGVPEEIITTQIADMVKKAIIMIGQQFKDVWQKEFAAPYYGETLKNYGYEWYNNTTINTRPNDDDFARFVDCTVNMLGVPNALIETIHNNLDWFKSARFRHFFEAFNPFANAYVLLHECVKNSCSWKWKKDIDVKEEIHQDVSWDLLAATFFGAFVPTITTTTTRTAIDKSRWIRSQVLADSAREAHEKDVRMVHEILEEMKYCWK